MTINDKEVRTAYIAMPGKDTDAQEVNPDEVANFIQMFMNLLDERYTVKRAFQVATYATEVFTIFKGGIYDNMIMVSYYFV